LLLRIPAIEACFGSLDHAALMDRVRERIADKRVLRLVKAFLHSGILEEQGALERTVTGTPQGGILVRLHHPLIGAGGEVVHFSDRVLGSAPCLRAA
jgi:hypothetical protein